MELEAAEALVALQQAPGPALRSARPQPRKPYARKPCRHGQYTYDCYTCSRGRMCGGAGCELLARHCSRRACRPDLYCRSGAHTALWPAPRVGAGETECYFCRTGKRRGGKEDTVVRHLTQEVFGPLGVEVSVDRAVFAGLASVRYRPDILVDLEGSACAVVVEVDEWEHGRGNYDSLCESRRMGELVQHLGKRIVFVRYNPDPYRRGGRLCRVPQQARLAELARVVSDLVRRVQVGYLPSQPYETVYLFYSDVAQKEREEAVRYTLDELQTLFFRS